ncbi:hypothetical protein Phi18:3_gp110 [Cellulophaga phage phi18:3]|uniref:Uncharacterized protein n=1 Tax=Cellulophaga phage phi18:3 TaxID=1327983 RepID=S0A2C6_9CAUD|nr:hypothetical protein Phi18:3_gp110 [Cellulophaga phage phi18:3]AGO48622.1 hypothetical protein Phi18:3_gp110 [Cellulophaga phage phi18:3]
MTKQIKETKTFNLLNKMQQTMTLKKGPVEEIRLGCTMSKLKSFDFWIKTCSPRDLVRNIVEEINKQ